jgi:hypothetical protein
MKVTAIEEAQDISSMRVDELIGSLQTFEMAINDRSKKKNNTMAFISNTDDCDYDEIQCDMEMNKEIDNAIVELRRQLKQAWRRADKRSRPNVQNIRFNINTQPDNQKKVTSDDEITQPKGFQCHECEGYGHIKSDCATYLKRQKKSLVVSWSDEDDSEGESESTKHINALTGICMSDAESCDEDLTYEELLAASKELYEKDLEICKVLKKQKKTINKLLSEKDENLTKITDLTDDVTQLNSQLENMKKQVRMLNSGTTVLEEILGSQNKEKPKGIDFDYRTMNNSQQNKENKFVHAVNEYEPTSGKQMLKHSPQHHGSNVRRRSQRWVCHHCGRKGHIRPFCFKLYGYPEWYQQAKAEPEVINVKKEWKSKEGSSSLVTKATPITTVPEIAAKKNKTSTVKNGTFMPVSDSPFASINVHFGTVGNKDYPVVVKKTHTMTSLFLDPINPQNVEKNVDTYEKGFVVSNVETSDKFVT